MIDSSLTHQFEIPLGIDTQNGKCQLLPLQLHAPTLACIMVLNLRMIALRYARHHKEFLIKVNFIVMEQKQYKTKQLLPEQRCTTHTTNVPCNYQSLSPSMSTLQTSNKNLLSSTIGDVSTHWG